MPDVSLAYSLPQTTHKTGILRKREGKNIGGKDIFLCKISGLTKKLWYCVVLERGVDAMGKRRANGDGMLRRRADGRWEGRAVVLCGVSVRRDHIYALLLFHFAAAVSIRRKIITEKTLSHKTKPETKSEIQPIVQSRV